jgi:putative flippase GtrA
MAVPRRTDCQNRMNEPDLLTTPEAESSPAISTIGAEGVHEFIRYAVASGVALVADVCSLYVLTSLFSVSYLISGAISFGIGLIIVYVLSTVWVFDHHVLRDARIEFVLFALIGVIGLGLNELVLWVLTGFFGTYYLVSKGASVVLVFLWNFGARKRLLFR